MTRRALRMTHPHTGLPLEPVGFRADGRPIWPILGASDDDGDGGTDDADTDDGGDDQDDDGGDGADDDKPLGPAGEKALQAEKKRRREVQAQLREFKALGLSPQQIKALVDAGNEGDKPDADKIREQARAEAKLEAARERVVDKIEAKAARAFADAEDAVAILLRQHQVDDFLDDGKIDVEAIEDALKDLLAKKPHLAVQDGKRFKGDADGGARKESRPTQLSKADVERMYANKQYDEIEKARQEGRLNDVLGVTS